MDLNNRRKIYNKDESESIIDSDEIFAFIVGYTEGGFPYGVTWEEMEIQEGTEDKVEKDIDLPFE